MFLRASPQFTQSPPPLFTVKGKLFSVNVASRNPTTLQEYSETNNHSGLCPSAPLFFFNPPHIHQPVSLTHTLEAAGAPHFQALAVTSCPLTQHFLPLPDRRTKTPFFPPQNPDGNRRRQAAPPKTRVRSVQRNLFPFFRLCLAFNALAFFPHDRSVVVFFSAPSRKRGTVSFVRPNTSPPGPLG